MSEMAVLRAEAAKARAAATGTQRAALPCGEAQREDMKFHSEFRGELVEKDGQEFYLVEGYASMAERGYDMWDMFGPYKEIVSTGAFDRTLAASPMVVFRFNHGGTAMATTANGRLELSADAMGLRDRAWINPKRADVRDLITAIEDRDVGEQSFMFTIEDGEWSEDYTEFRINQVNLDRGDVGPVTYGANPHTVIASRAGEFLSAIPDMPALAAREAMKRLAQRPDLPDLTDPDDIDALTVRTVAEDRAAETLARISDGAARARPIVSLEPESPGGTSIRLRLAQLEVDKQHP